MSDPVVDSESHRILSFEVQGISGRDFGNAVANALAQAQAAASNVLELDWFEIIEESALLAEGRRVECRVAIRVGGSQG